MDGTSRQYTPTARKPSTATKDTPVNYEGWKLPLGRASDAAASRYLHAVDGRDKEIAAALSQLAARGNAAPLPKSIVVKN